MFDDKIKDYGLVHKGISTVEGLKTCTCCSKEKPSIEFEIVKKDEKRGKIYYRSVCKECRKSKKNKKSKKNGKKEKVIKRDRDTHYIWDESKKLKEIPLCEVKPVERSINHKLINIFEVFVPVEGTKNYWISNFGRFVDNLHYNENKTYNEHEYSENTFEIIETKTDNNQYIRNTTIEDLVADTFLVQYRYRCNIWHKDGDVTNNWYKNLLFVTPEDYERLKSGEITWQSLGLKQEYIEYKNKAIACAYMIYNAIKKRCGDSKNKGYRNATMCEEWLNNPEAFVKWYLEHYYSVNYERMAVDKDLFGDDTSEYSPQNCCLLPQGLNTMLSNCKKHYADENRLKGKYDILPLGVRKANGKPERYYGEITFTSTGELKKLSYWDTPEEAFNEYKRYKQDDILKTVAKYKENIPDYIYDRFLNVEVKPY